MKQKKMHPAYITLIVFLLLSMSVITYYEYKDKVINFGGIEIKSSNLDSITRPLPQGQYYLCSLKDNKCILSQKINLGDK